MNSSVHALTKVITQVQPAKQPTNIQKNTKDGDYVMDIFTGEMIKVKRDNIHQITPKDLQQTIASKSIIIKLYEYCCINNINYIPL